MNERFIAFVTGAAGDIGRATAVLLAGRGWDVALTDHPAAAEGLAFASRECAAAGADTWQATFDVTDTDRVESVIQRCCEEFGTPRGLFNNAGVQGSFDRVDRYPLAEARTTIDVNVFGALTVLSAVSASMVSAGTGGAVVCTASMAGVSGAPNMPVYSATKAAVLGLVKSAAKDLAPFGIRVNAVSPAFIGPGRMWENQVEQQAGAGSQYYATDAAMVAEQMIGMVPMRRYGSAEEVARVVSFLLSDDASYVTGTNIEVSGGSS
jgi:NAD(P)-dependent dehydrogenase (short-subunit alcohol dehydrogenase family)